MKAWRREQFENFAKNVKGLEGNVILVPSKTNKGYAVATKLAVLEEFYHAITIENDCSKTKNLTWLVDAIDAIQDFNELEFLIEEEVRLHSDCNGTPIVSYIECSQEGILWYLRNLETDNADLNLSDFSEMKEDEYEFPYDEITKKLLSLLRELVNPMTLRQKIEALTRDELFLLMDEYATLKKKGTIGDSLLRTLADGEESMISLNLRAVIMIVSEILALEYMKMIRKNNQGVQDGKF